MPRLWMLLACTVPFGLAACDGQGAAPTSARAAYRPVLVQHVVFEDRTPVRRLVATVRPRVEADFGFRVGGKVAQRLVDVGEHVAAGQALARLDETDFTLQRGQAEAERNAAAAALTQAQADLRRSSTLLSQGWTAAAAADRQQVATAEARGRLLRAERALTLAQNALAYTTLVADADGVVTATAIEPGQVVTPGQLAIRIAHTAEKEALVALPEALIERARGNQASLTLWSNPDRAYRAILRELAPSADTATRTYLAHYSLADPAPSVELGMTGTLTLADAHTDRVARLPLSALFDQGSGPAVWIVAADGHVELTPVTVAAYESRDVLIAGGVPDGAAVVTLGVQKLDSGQRVRIVEALQF